VAAQEPTLLDLAVVLQPAHSAQRQEYVAVLAGRLGLSVVVAPAGTSAQHLARLREAAAPARVETVDQVAGLLVETRDPAAVRAARAALDAAGQWRDPVVVQVPVAIGRTMNEAVARADRDPRLAGDPGVRERGLFGTFEQAQDQVLALARAGAGQLRLVLADELDVADLLAQVRALVVGATPALRARD
jgi:hypothetical protein